MLSAAPPQLTSSPPADLHLSDGSLDLRSWQLAQPLAAMEVCPAAPSALYGFASSGSETKILQAFDLSTAATASPETDPDTPPTPMAGTPCGDDVGHQKGGRALTFSADGGLVMSGGKDGQVVIRELPGGSIAASMRRHDGVGDSAGVVALALGARDTLYSAGGDGSIFELSGVSGAVGSDAGESFASVAPSSHIRIVDTPS